MAFLSQIHLNGFKTVHSLFQLLKNLLPKAPSEFMENTIQQNCYQLGVILQFTKLRISFSKRYIIKMWLKNSFFCSVEKKKVISSPINSHTFIKYANTFEAELNKMSESKCNITFCSLKPKLALWPGPYGPGCERVLSTL